MTETLSELVLRIAPKGYVIEVDKVQDRALYAVEVQDTEGRYERAFFNGAGVVDRGPRWIASEVEKAAKTCLARFPKPPSGWDKC